MEITESVELTVDNWREHLIVHSYEKTVEEKDAFGEVTSTRTERLFYLGADVNRYHSFSENAIIELKHKQTGDMNIYNLSTTWVSYGPEDPTEINIVKNLDDYECTRIQGCVYYLDIPEEVLIPTDDSDMLAEIWFTSKKTGRGTNDYIRRATKELSRPLDEILDGFGYDISPDTVQ